MIHPVLRLDWLVPFEMDDVLRYWFPTLFVLSARCRFSKTSLSTHPPFIFKKKKLSFLVNGAITNTTIVSFSQTINKIKEIVKQYDIVFLTNQSIIHGKLLSFDVFNRTRV